MSDLSKIYAKLHENRWYHVEQARKGREWQLQAMKQGQKDWLALGSVIFGIFAAGFALGYAVAVIAQ